jgi:MSHA biogenesis protein MshO
MGLRRSTAQQWPLPGVERGLTLVEMVTAIVIMSIIAIGLTRFITNASESYVQTAARNQVSAAGRVVIERISMELHNALPESVRVSAVATSTNPATGNAGDQCLEFIPVKGATTYLDPAFRPAALRTGFDVVDFVPSLVGESGLYAAIYPVSPAELYQDSFASTGAIVPATLEDAVAGDGKQRLITGAHRFKRRSAVERLFITGQPVSYCLSGNKLYRYANYGFHQTQLQPVAPNGSCASLCLPNATPHRVLVTDQLENSTLDSDAPAGSAFGWTPANRQRNGVVQLLLNFSVDGQQVLLNHEVMQRVTP